MSRCDYRLNSIDCLSYSISVQSTSRPKPWAPFPISYCQYSLQHFYRSMFLHWIYECDYSDTDPLWLPEHCESLFTSQLNGAQLLPSHNNMWWNQLLKLVFTKILTLFCWDYKASRKGSSFIKAFYKVKHWSFWFCKIWKHPIPNRSF